MTEKTIVSDAQREVWDWKTALYEDVAHLPRREALRTLLGNAGNAMATSGVCLPKMNSTRSLMAVAEDSAAYETKA
jgi:hypothetical protein